MSKETHTSVKRDLHCLCVSVTPCLCVLPCLCPCLCLCLCLGVRYTVPSSRLVMKMAVFDTTDIEKMMPALVEKLARDDPILQKDLIENKRLIFLPRVVSEFDNYKWSHSSN